VKQVLKNVPASTVAPAEQVGPRNFDASSSVRYGRFNEFNDRRYLTLTMTAFDPRAI